MARRWKPDDDEEDQAEKFQRGAPQSRHFEVRRVLFNEDKAGVPYKLCADVSLCRLVAAQDLLNSELVNILSCLMQIYSWRCNTNTRFTPADVVRARFEQALPDFKFPIHEIAKRYAMKNALLKDYGLPADGGKTINWKSVHLRSFINHLHANSSIIMNRQIVHFYRLDKDVDGQDMAMICNNLQSLKLIQFLNSVGDAVENLSDALWSECKGPSYNIRGMRLRFRFS